MGKSKHRLKKLSVLAVAFMIAGTSYSGFTSPALAAAGEPAASEPYVWKNVMTGGGGGFIPGIVFNASEPNLIYARTDIGGAYRWEQGTGTWKQLLGWVGMDDWSKSGVDALATDPVDPDRLYLAVGTYTNSWDPHNGRILRSTDRGETWEETELPFKVGGNMPGRSLGERLVIDPNQNNVLYFGARSGNGLWKSTDYGETWSKVSQFPNPGTYVENPDNEYQSDITGLAWITFDPATGSRGQATQTIYVGVADKNESVYRSTDGGETWEAVPGQPSGYLPHHGVLSSDGFLYITYSNGAGPYDGTKGEVWKLNTSTGEWTNISPVPSSSDDNYYGYGGLAVDAQNPGTVMVATLNSWWPDAIIFRSTDGGATWSRIWDWNGYPSRTLRYNHDISAAPWLDFGNYPIPPEITPKLGWMIGDLEIDPFNSDRMMYGTGATIYGTDNLTEWDKGGKIDLEVKAEGIEETSVTALISPPSGAHLLSGNLDVTGFRHDDLTQAPAKMFTNPAGTVDMDYAELDPGFIVRVATVNRSEKPNDKAIGFSRDGGGNWYTGGEPSGTSGGGTIALAARGESLVWSTSDVGVHYSKGGNSWTASSGVPAGALVASDRVNSNLFYALSGGSLYVSRDGGASFTKTSATGLPASGDLDLKAMPGREGDVWVAGGRAFDGNSGLWHSSDAGATFTKLTSVEEASVIGFGKPAPGRNVMALYTSGKIGGERGFFRSDDGGESWVRINDDQHQYGTTNSAITGDPRIFGRVYIGTNGYGIVYGDTTVTPQEPEEPGEPGEPQEPGQNATISPTSATFDLKQGNQADISVALTLNDKTFSGIYNGTTQLKEGVDYTVSDSKVTILQEFLAAQPTGTLKLTFRFSAGADALLNIAIMDSTKAPNGSLRIEAVNGTLQSTANTLNPRIRLTNTGTEELALKDVTLRYYYTVDGEKGQNLFCDWTQVGSGNVTGSFVKLPEAANGADYYAEIGFTEAAGTLAPGQTIDLHIRISKEDWSNYSQSDDYSFNPDATSYAETLKITGYVGGALQWGLEP
ncbi:xyloglucanase [Paenibacillus macerans]|uniref:X2-like carbohydrate binding domain-containing protein n=1 Tax=Paenibacillus macerans TaxID=44252 RepID=UPI001F0E6CEA|nr:X2-like carbohydrate binding domain-containing protein [Paenibacillus macerans]MEC0333664.1 X2-like carbohydrate binding domain-containing protein [Paenibacillus macerans]UMV45192.1 xyloglucanase [Paenibacillus macerans]